MQSKQFWGVLSVPKTVMTGARAVLSMAFSGVEPVRRAGVPMGAKAAAEATNAEKATNLAAMAVNVRP